MRNKLKEKIMLLRKYMSWLGIGSAQVDLLLKKEVYHQGECVEGCFEIHGGLIEQEVKRIECDLVKVNLLDKSEEIVDSLTMLTSKTVDSEENNQIPFHFTLPSDLTPSSSSVSFRFKTRMIFQHGIKSIDQDLIKVIPKEGASYEDIL
jgi:sporulation-control protein